MVVMGDGLCYVVGNVVFVYCYGFYYLGDGIQFVGIGVYGFLIVDKR